MDNTTITKINFEMLISDYLLLSNLAKSRELELEFQGDYLHNFEREEMRNLKRISGVIDSKLQAIGVK